MTQFALDTHDLRDFYAEGERRDLFVEGVRKSLSTTGFFLLSNHQMQQVVIDHAWELLPKFFRDLTQEQRDHYVGDDVVGYTPPGKETGEGFSIPDAKHFVHVRDGVALPVREVPNFAPALISLSNSFNVVATALLQAIALSVRLPVWYFDSLEGNSLLRALHYPEHPNPTEHEGQLVAGGNAVGMCAAPHTDINMITLLLAREPGLELEYEGLWEPITLDDPNLMIVNGADILRHITGGRYKSGKHRVVCRPDVERYSIPYFVHIKPETSIVPLKHLGESDLKEFHYRTAGEFIHARLVELGVIKE